MTYFEELNICQTKPHYHVKQLIDLLKPQTFNINIILRIQVLQYNQG